MSLKKLVLFLSCVLLLGIQCSSAGAAYPDHLGGDKNYILSGGHMGCGWYLDKSSLKVLQEGNGNALLTVRVVEVTDADRGSTAVTGQNDCRYSYNEKKMRMYSFWDQKWHYVEPVGCMAQTGHEFSGELAYYIAFHKKFYGGRKWLDPYTGKYASPNFGAELYDRADAAE